LQLNNDMSTFALERIEAVVGRQRFDKLFVDGVCPFDEFENNIEAQYRKEIPSLYAIMNDVANLKSVPYTKFHPYDRGFPREYEIKTRHLRVYAIEQEGGKIIVIGGTKANQKKDQAKFRSIKEKYISFLKKIKRL